MKFIAYLASTHLESEATAPIKVELSTRGRLGLSELGLHPHQPFSRSSFALACEAFSSSDLTLVNSDAATHNVMLPYL